MSAIGDYLHEIDRQSRRGRCLHFDAGKRCAEIIGAHSIQRANHLLPIATDGHVYRFNSNLATLKRSKGIAIATRIGINRVSTFFGFCRTHDNALFEPIDNSLLVPTAQQIFLYAYRSICRELFVKENALNVYAAQKDNQQISPQWRHLLRIMEDGARWGHQSLLYHKSLYDASLMKHSFDDITYTAFIATDQPSVLFSGILLPDYDFLGNLIQDISDTRHPLSSITFFSAPMPSGWAFVFAWHRTSDPICSRYIGSLAECVHRKERLADILFRYVFACCENHAMSPIWWENLPATDQEDITKYFNGTHGAMQSVEHDYLRSGLEGISPWSFSRVICEPRS